MSDANGNDNATPQDLESLEKLKTAYTQIRTEWSKVIIGQDEVIEQLLIAIFAQGHCLLEGVPGLAQALVGGTLAK